MRVLKLCAIDLDNRVGVTKENLGCCFDDSGFPRASRTKKQQCADGTVCLIETRKEKLVETTHPADSVLLTDNARRKFLVEVLDARTLNSGVEEEVVFCSLLCSHLRKHDVSPLSVTTNELLSVSLSGNPLADVWRTISERQAIGIAFP